MIHMVPLGAREVEETTKHHLIPRSESKRHQIKPSKLPTANLCRQCHKKLHSLFTNRYLGDALSTIESIKNQDEIQKYLIWVNKISGAQVLKERH